MSEIKLLPCPFCGGEAEIEEHKFWNDITRSFDIKTYGVKCQKCSAGGFQFFRLENDAIIHWNTRKPMERIVEIVEGNFEEANQFGCGGIITDMVEAIKEEGGIE